MTVFDRAPAADDPAWPRASAWLAGTDDAAPGPDAPRLRVVGVPTSVGSISRSEAWRTPGAVRDALARLSTWDATAGVDLREAVAVRDLGDWDLASLPLEEAVARTHVAAAGLDGAADLHVFLGGDNAITRPVVTGLLGPGLADVGLVTLDAHHDVRTLDDGPRNGTPVRGLITDGLRGEHVWQLGIAAFANSAPYAAWAHEQRIGVVTAAECHADGVERAVDRALAGLPDVRAVHVDVDVDVLDVAHAPACPGARPGGWRPDQLFTAVRRLAADPRVRSLDVVEVDAAADSGGRTVLVAAMVLLHAAAGLAARRTAHG